MLFLIKKNLDEQGDKAPDRADMQILDILEKLRIALTVFVEIVGVYGGCMEERPIGEVGVESLRIQRRQSSALQQESKSKRVSAVNYRCPVADARCYTGLTTGCQHLSNLIAR